MSVDSKHERLVDSTEVARGNLLVLRHDTVVGADGENHLREVVVHRGGVAIVPLTGRPRGRVGAAVPPRCRRVTARDTGRDAGPAGQRGHREPGQGGGAPSWAKRSATPPVEWLKFGRFYSAPGFTDPGDAPYLARRLRPIEGYAGPEADESLEIERLPLDAALRLAASGEIRDAKTLVGLFWLGRWLAENEG